MYETKQMGLPLGYYPDSGDTIFVLIKQKTIDSSGKFQKIKNILVRVFDKFSKRRNADYLFDINGIFFPFLHPRIPE